MAWRLATRNLGLVATLVLVRLLEPSDFGLVAIATGFAATADALSWIGVQDALICEKDRDRLLYDTAFALSVARGAVTAAALLAAAWPVAAFFGDARLAPVMVALAVGLMLSAFENVGIVDFRRDLAFAKDFALQLWPRVAGVAVTMLSAWQWRSFWALVAGLLATRAARLALSYAMSSYRPRFAIGAWRRLIGFSLWTWAGALLIQVRERADQMIVGRAMGTEAVGTYSVGAELGTLATSELIEPMHRALFSGFAAMRREEEGQAKLFADSLGFAALIVMPVAVGVSAVAEPTVALLLGTRWMGAARVIEILSVASIASIFNVLSSAFLMSNDGPQTGFWLLARSTAVRLPAVVAGAALWGLPGVAVGVALSQWVEFGFAASIVLPKVGVGAQDAAARCARRRNLWFGVGFGEPVRFGGGGVRRRGVGVVGRARSAARGRGHGVGGVRRHVVEVAREDAKQALTAPGRGHTRRALGRPGRQDGAVRC